MTRAAGTATRRRDMFAVGEDAALAGLGLTQAAGGYQLFSVDHRTRSAIGGAGQVLTGATPDDLDRKIRAHWQEMQ